MSKLEIEGHDNCKQMEGGELRESIIKTSEKISGEKKLTICWCNGHGVNINGNSCYVRREGGGGLNDK